MPRDVQQSVILPAEITDAIIDFLSNDLHNLGACSVVCSDWLTRTRYHVFSTIRLRPWRVPDFADLTRSPHCTFLNHIHRFEFDDDSSACKRTTPTISGHPQGDLSAHIQLNYPMTQLHLPRFPSVRSIQIRNVNWTTLSPSEQLALRSNLAKLPQLQRLELANVTFHDLREVVRLVESLPKLDQLGVDVTFMKYLEHTLASAGQLRLPNRLTTIELGSEDSIPVVLACINAGQGRPHVLALKLQNVQPSHWSQIRSTLRGAGTALQHITLRFDCENNDSLDTEALADAINFSRLGHLRTLCISGLKCVRSAPGAQNVVPKSVERTIPSILSTIESSFLESVELRFTADHLDDVETFDWSHLEKVLLGHHFFGMANVRVAIEAGIGLHHGACIAKIRQLLPGLESKNALTVQALSVAQGDGSSDLFQAHLDKS